MPYSLTNTFLSLTIQPLHRWLAAMGLVLLICSGCSERSGENTADFNIEQYRGHWVVINYWAEWCLPCIKEIPEFNRLATEHSSTLRVFAVNYDRITGEALQALASRMGIDFNLIEHDPAPLLRLSRPASLPTTYLFNPQGELAAKLVGPQTAEDILARIKWVDSANTPRGGMSSNQDKHRGDANTSAR